MRGKLWFISGMAAGFVLGARAGRETYENLIVNGRKLLDHPTVQEAAGVAQAQANRLYAQGKDKLNNTKLGERLGTGNGWAPSGTEDKFATSVGPGSSGGTPMSTSKSESSGPETSGTS